MHQNSSEMTFRSTFLMLFTVLLLTSCSTDKNEDQICAPDKAVLSSFLNEDGRMIEIYEDGDAYFIEDGQCTFAANTFDPDFFEENYVETADGVRQIVDETTLFTPFRSFIVQLEQATNINDLFIRDLDDRQRIINHHTLQSPSTPTVSEYVSLAQCIIEEECGFIDNRVELSSDPENDAQEVLKFFSVAPNATMVTAKSSIASSLCFFREGDDFWFEARYYLEQGRPTTLADFESSYFLNNPGPRVIFRGDRLAIENKFGAKITYNQLSNTAISFPLKEWVKVKVHLKYSTTDGIIQVWQNDQLIIDEVGATMPYDFWIQNGVEFGISATQEECTLYMDDIRFSDQSF